MSQIQEEKKAGFPIRELSARTQVNTVTLRAWERRYGLLKPQRSEKGHRLYSEQDVATIEKVLTLMARGVPIGKVKPLLKEDITQIEEEEVSNTWQPAVEQLVESVEALSVTKVESQLQQTLSSYPIDIVLSRLIEPSFAALSHKQAASAFMAFLESEVYRYVVMRLNAKVTKSKTQTSITLICGNQAPMWRLALAALELTDLDHKVYLFALPLTIPTAIESLSKLNASKVVIYQDGTWKDNEEALSSKALKESEHLLLCGTAPDISGFKQTERVFGDLKQLVVFFK
ncbi:MerR family transcriptional regulator [Marinomonas sp. C2222]|uniref:MerR family transcriptional regulator n=1 Tax=Marinomonas sargassi TaxID=2984494 RepID=A0ABT2YUV3_9GAMM|nr:MerR family transcriptional regulator [Marinomonas sargassi]MCV2403669.1 MerR family transcriptional regulator [Marinomonas sargassi]